MSTPIEDRLRAHFADRAERDPLGPTALPFERPRHVERPDPRRRRLVMAAALVLVAGTITGVAAVVRDDSQRVDTITPDVDPTTSAPVPATTAPPTATSGAPTTTSPTPMVRSVIVGVTGVLGWWDGARWIRQDEGTVPAVGGERYQVVGVDRPITEAVGSAPTTSCDVLDVPNADIALDPAAFAMNAAGPFPIAVSGIADAQPRPVDSMPLDDLTYANAVRAAFAEQGVAIAVPTLTDLVRVDLDGDGADEVVGTANHGELSLDVNPAGDFSVVFVRRVADGRARTTVLWAFAADGESDHLARHRLAAIADLNGDGVMEIVVEAEYYEGRSVIVWSHDDEDAVLGLACGL